MIVTPELPPNALLRKCRDAGAYTDCYATEVAARVSHAAFVEAFYTTWVFKLERLVLKWLVSKPSTDDDARRLARGEAEAFAAWTVEARAPDQLLLADFLGRTKSWLMIAAVDESHTRLYFGSAVVPGNDVGRALARHPKSRAEARPTFLLGFHKLYSRILLRAAAAKFTTAAR